MRYTVDYSSRPRLEPGEGFAAFAAGSDASRFAEQTAEQEPGVTFSVYKEGNLIQTFKKGEDK